MKNNRNRRDTRKFQILHLGLFTLLLQSALAQSTVTTTADSGPGSLRAALTWANANPGRDFVNFAIPGNGPFTIHLQSPLPPITDPVEIDGYTQANARANTLAVGDNAALQIQLDGSQIAYPAYGLLVMKGSEGSTIRGLNISGFPYGPGIWLGTSSNRVEGCFLGTDITGRHALPNTNGVRVTNAGYNQIGGTDPAARNVISGNVKAGLRIEGPGSIETVVQGNYIGTDISGRKRLGNGGPGILIGLQLPSGPGASNTHVGGMEPADPYDPAAANVIAFNAGSGVTIWDNNLGLRRTDRNRILGNSIFGNTDLSIDLTSTFDGVHGNGVTPNDPLDQDTGANQFQNAPTMPLLCTNCGANVKIGGKLSSEPGQTYRIEIFANSTCGFLAMGQGEEFVTWTNVTTDSQGDAPFDLCVPPVVGKPYYSATATSTNGNTSEFAPCGVHVDCCTSNCPSDNPTLTVAPSGAGPSAAQSAQAGLLVAAPSANGLVCRWVGEGFVLQTATSPTGPWSSLTLGTLVSTNSIPQFEAYVPVVSAQQFFRAVGVPPCAGLPTSH